MKAWQEALDYIAMMNRIQVFGFPDWCLPDPRELRSFMSHQTRKTAFPEGHFLVNVFSGWYWTSTTAINTTYAWYIHGGRTNVLRPEGTVFPDGHLIRINSRN